MKVLITNDAKKIAGGENYVLHLAEGLSQKGYEILIAPLRNSELELEANRRGYRTISISYASKGREFNLVRDFVHKFRNEKVDVIHSNSNLDRTIASFAGKIIGAKNIASIHSCLSINRNLVHWYRNKYIIDHFTPVGFSTRKIMIESDKIPSDKITVVHIGIPENSIKRTEEGRKKVRKEFCIGHNEFVVGTLSRLVEFKGHKFLLKAIQHVIIESALPIKLMIVGDGELKVQLIQLAKEYGIYDRVIFTGNRKDVSDILSAFDVFAQFSINGGGETFPVAIIEALATELPVIGSKVGDIEYLIDNNINGFLVEPENVQQFANSLKNLINNNELLKIMGEKSNEKFIKEFTLDKMIRSVEEVYNKVMMN